MNIEIAKDNQITIKELLARQALRDHFAGLAMPEIYQRVETGGFERVAKLSYEMADAMLKERAK
jgi:hypothetical protein